MPVRIMDRICPGIRVPCVCRWTVSRNVSLVSCPLSLSWYPASPTVVPVVEPESHCLKLCCGSNLMIQVPGRCPRSPQYRHALGPRDPDDSADSDSIRAALGPRLHRQWSTHEQHRRCRCTPAAPVAWRGHAPAPHRAQQNLMSLPDRSLAACRRFQHSTLRLAQPARGRPTADSETAAAGHVAGREYQSQGQATRRRPKPPDRQDRGTTSPPRETRMR